MLQSPLLWHQSSPMGLSCEVQPGWNGEVEVSVCLFHCVCVYTVLTDRITLHYSLFTPTHIPHKGVRNGGVTKRKPPKRVLRILQAGLLTTTTPPVIFATERSKDTCSQMVVDRILPWVCTFSCSILYLRMFTAVSGS